MHIPVLLEDGTWGCRCGFWTDRDRDAYWHYSGNFQSYQDPYGAPGVTWRRPAAAPERWYFELDVLV
jgi:hypothetical protein